MLLKIDNLRIHYGAVEAIKGVSLELEEGTVISLLGANGAGKTTILKAISGLLLPTSGTIWLESQRIDKLPPQRINKLGIAHVPEGRRVFPYMSVTNNLMMGAFLRKDKSEIRKDLEEIYRSFPILKERSRQQAGSLSGGEQQMLAIGRALMSKPKVLLMDEPSMGLSPILVQEIGEIVKNIHGRGVSIILVEQNVQLALRVAQRGYVLETGLITLQGEAKALLSDERVKKAYLGG